MKKSQHSDPWIKAATKAIMKLWNPTPYQVATIIAAHAYKKTRRGKITPEERDYAKKKFSARPASDVPPSGPERPKQ